MKPLDSLPTLIKESQWRELSRPPEVGLEQLDPANEASLQPGPSWAAASCPRGQSQGKPSSQGCLFWAPSPGRGSQSPPWVQVSIRASWVTGLPGPSGPARALALCLSRQEVRGMCLGNGAAGSLPSEQRSQGSEAILRTLA